MPVIVGITGNIGCGKSLVGTLLADHGIPVIDSDHISHELYKNHELVQKEVIKNFGTLDRKKLGKIIFSDPKKRKLLESIIHPRIAERLGEWVRENEDKEIVANLVPLLFEAKLEDRFDVVVTVLTEEKTQIERIQSRNPDWSMDEIMKRIGSQIPQEEKKARSQFVIDNSGAMDETMKQVAKLVEDLKKTAKEKGLRI